MIGTINLAFMLLLTSTPASPPLVLEIYNAASPEPAAECRAAGFNALVVANREQLDLCQRLGFKGIFGGLPHTATSYDADQVRKTVESVRDHPALHAYILLDEPDLRWWSAPPSMVAEMAKIVREADPHHPVQATFSGFLGARALVPYTETVDVIRLDSYPFYYNRPLAWPAEVIDSCRAATGDSKPIWLIQQAWSNVEAFPSPDYDRCLSYLALIHGVRGIGHYAYLFGDRGTTQTLPANEPEFWAYLKAFTSQLALLSELNDPPANARLFCGSRGGRIEWVLRRRGKEMLLLMANPSNHEDWAQLGTLDPIGLIAASEGGMTLARQSDGGASLLLKSHETVLARVTGTNPPPACEPLLPVTVELADLRPGANAYEKVLVRNHGDAIADCRIVISDPQTGEVLGETRTSIPGNVAASRVVYVKEPAWKVLTETNWTIAHGYPGPDFLLEFPTMRQYQLRLTSMDGNNLACSTYGYESLSISSNYIANASVTYKEVLKDVSVPMISSSLTAPQNGIISEATVQIYLPFLTEPMQQVVQPNSRYAHVSIDYKLPEGDYPQFLDCYIRWIIKKEGRPRDLWLHLPLQIQPRIQINEERPIFVPQGQTRESSLNLKIRTKTPLTLKPSLAMPEGWSAELKVQELVISSSSYQASIPFNITAPTGSYGRSEGALSLSSGGVNQYTLPLTISRPLYYDHNKTLLDISADASRENAPANGLQSPSPDDLNASLKLLHNGKSLAVRCDVTDNAHHINASGEGGLWRGDSLQISLLVSPELHRTPEAGDPGFVNFGIAYDGKTDKILVDVGFVGSGIDKETARKSIKGWGRRRDNVTTYILVFPFKELGIDGKDFSYEPRFSLLVNDYDKADLSDRHWIEFGGGIVRGTDPYHFTDLVLEN